MTHPRPLQRSGKPRTHRVRRSAALALAAAAIAAGVVVPAAIAQADAAASRGAAEPSSAPVTLNFVNAEIEAVTRAIAAMINRQMLVDPRVRGTVTLYSERPVPPREAYQNYLSALRGLGFAVVESAGLLKVVPEADAKLQTSVVSVGPAEPQRGDQVITQVFRLQHENPNNLVAVLRPLISPNNTINANPSNQSLVITDYAENLARIGKIIAALDQSTATDIEIVPLKHAVAADLVTMVQRLGEGVGPPGLVPGAAAAAASVIADSRSNSLIVRAPNPSRLAALRALIERLDRPSAAGPAGSIYVVYLKNADAVKLASVLRAAFGGGGGTSAAPTPAAPAPTPAVGGVQAGTGITSAASTTPVATSGPPSTGGFVQADPATNSLIITAVEPLYRQIRAMIDQLDTRRAQVYIESLIVEVTGDNAADFGFQWQGLIGRDGDKNIGVLGTNLKGTRVPSIIEITTSALAGTPVVGQGLNVGLVRNFSGTYALAAIAQFLQTRDDTNILSTPNLITLDNEEAKLVIGKNLPFVTGQFTNTGTATTNPFQTIERRDIGLVMRIKPQIGEGGTVRMSILQESSDVAEPAAGTAGAGPTTSKRSIESTVVVDDGQILVLGGQIEERVEVHKTQIPVLGDLPVLGPLFRSESRTRKRSNLMIFLRPTVLRDAESANRLSLDRYDLIRASQRSQQSGTAATLPDASSPLLTPLPASAPTSGGPAAPMPPLGASTPAVGRP